MQCCEKSISQVIFGLPRVFWGVHRSRKRRWSCAASAPPAPPRHRCLSLFFFYFRLPEKYCQFSEVKIEMEKLGQASELHTWFARGRSAWLQSTTVISCAEALETLESRRTDAMAMAGGMMSSSGRNRSALTSANNRGREHKLMFDFRYRCLE